MSEAPVEFSDIIEYDISAIRDEAVESKSPVIIHEYITRIPKQQEADEVNQINSEHHYKMEEHDKDEDQQSSRKNDSHKRFLLFDNLVAEIVDYDGEDGAPIVEFSLCANEQDEEELPVECGICPDVMPKALLDSHVKTHIKPGTKRFVCIYCEENFVSRAYAAGHARRHMGIRPYVCAPCKIYYCTKQDLRVHQLRRHSAKEHICEKCGKTFSQYTCLKNHNTLVHEQIRRFECEYCGKRFLRNYAKKEHVRNVHLGDRRPLDCPFCDLRFKDTHKLAQHRKENHLHQSQFECRACGMEFTNIDFFDAHRRSLQCRKKYKQIEEDLHEKLKQEQEIENEQEEHAQESQQLNLYNIINDVVEDDESIKDEDVAKEEILYEISVDNL